MAAATCDVMNAGRMRYLHSGWVDPTISRCWEGEEESSDETEIYGEFHIAEAEPAFEHSFRAL
jgi:hypothetical protein